MIDGFLDRRYRYRCHHLPVFLPNLHLFHIHSLHKPSSLSIPIRSKDDVITTHHPLPHFPRLPVKGPVLESIAPFPAHPVIRILVLIPELDGNPIIGEGKHLLKEPVAAFPLPFGGQEVDDGVGPGEEVAAVAPDGIGSVGLRDSGWISVGVSMLIDDLRILLVYYLVV